MYRRSSANLQDGVYSEIDPSFAAPNEFNTDTTHTTLRSGFEPVNKNRFSETSSSYRAGGRKLAPSSSFLYDLNAEFDGRGIATDDNFTRTRPEGQSRVPFLHRPPGQSTLCRFDSVSSLNTEGSFYQAGSLDDLPDAEDDIEDNASAEDEWHVNQEQEAGDNDPDGDEEQEQDTASENEDNELSTVVGSAYSRANSPSSTSAFGGTQEYQEEEADDSDSDGDQEQEQETASENEDNESTVVGSAYSRANSSSSASAFGGSQEYQSEWDLDTIKGEESVREDTPAPRANNCVSDFLYSISAPLQSTHSISVTAPYKTRSGQVPGYYVGKHGTPKRRREWGESISANPYARKRRGKKNHD